MAIDASLRTKSRTRNIFAGAGAVFLALAATRATDLMFYDPGLINWAGPQGSFDIVRGRGIAPEQYRYLSHLLVVLLAHMGGFRVAVNVLTFASLAAFFSIVLFAAWPR